MTRVLTMEPPRPWLDLYSVWLKAPARPVNEVLLSKAALLAPGKHGTAALAGTGGEVKVSEDIHIPCMLA